MHSQFTRLLTWISVGLCFPVVAAADPNEKQALTFVEHLRDAKFAEAAIMMQPADESDTERCERLLAIVVRELGYPLAALIADEPIGTSSVGMEIAAGATDWNVTAPQDHEIISVGTDFSFAGTGRVEVRFIRKEGKWYFTSAQFGLPSIRTNRDRIEALVRYFNDAVGEGDQ